MSTLQSASGLCFFSFFVGGGEGIFLCFFLFFYEVIGMCMTIWRSLKNIYICYTAQCDGLLENSHPVIFLSYMVSTDDGDYYEEGDGQYIV